jgi:acetone carboxylase gamma subunit
MAKKVVATLQSGGKDWAKVLRMVKSPKTGAYIFTEEMVQNDKVKDYLAKK